MSTRHSRLSDLQLIKKFYSFPVKKLISNLFSFVAFIFGFIYMSKSSDENSTIIALSLFALGTLFAVLSRMFFNDIKRREFAVEMMNRYNDNSSANPYFYLFRKEKELTGKVKDTSKFIDVLCIIFSILNYIFSIFAALIFVVFTAAIAIVVFAFSYFLYLFFVVARANVLADAMLQLSKLAPIPFKLALKFGALALKLDFTKEDFNSIKSTLNTPKQPLSQAEAELKIDNYISLSSLVTPGYCHWASGPYLSASANNVYVEGSLACDSNSHSTDGDVSQTVSQMSDEIRRILDGQISKFLQDYPQVQRAHIDIDIKGYID